MTVQRIWAADRVHELDEMAADTPRSNHHEWEPSTLTMFTGVLTNEATVHGPPVLGVPAPGPGR